MTAGEIEGLAREYATTRPTALRVNYGVQRTEYGGEAVRIIAMLPALTGAWKHRGGGGGLSMSGAFQWDEDALRRPDLALASPLGRLARTVNMCELGEALEERGCRVSGIGYRTDEGAGTQRQGPGTEGTVTRSSPMNLDAPETSIPQGLKPTSSLALSGTTEVVPFQNVVRETRSWDCPPVKALFVYNSNPGAVAPDQNAVRRGLGRADLFTVVHEQFFNDTTDYADWVLPATTFLEHTDVQGAYGHYYVGLSQQAIEPVGEARSNVWLFGQLGQRMGFEEECFRDTPEEMVKQALGIGADGHSQGGHSRNKGMEHITLEDLKERGHIPVAFHRDPLNGNPGTEPFLPYVAGTQATQTGKIEFDSEVLKARGLDGLPGFKPPTESRWGEDAKRFPLEFLSRKADNYMNSTFANLDGHRKMEARTNQRLEINPADAAARGIGEGDAVRIWNDRGEMRLTAMLNEHLPAGVVAGRLDWGKMNADGANVNALTSQRLTDIGAGATFYSTLVEVEKR
jgi:anaerobic selenocysteine-containing dehydrogenase